jgi:hypothetical protein
VAHTKPRDRRVIGRLLRGDHPVGDNLHTATLNPTRGALTPRVRIHQKRHHHRRLKRRATPPVLTVGTIKRLQMHLFHRRQNEPRQMAIRQPIPRVRGHQERLLTITRQEVHSHTQKCLNPPGQTGGLRDTHRPTQYCGARREHSCNRQEQKRHDRRLTVLPISIREVSASVLQCAASEPLRSGARVACVSRVGLVQRLLSDVRLLVGDD